MKDKRPPKSPATPSRTASNKIRDKRPSDRRNPVSDLKATDGERPSKGRKRHKTQSQNDRRKSRRSGGGEVAPKGSAATHREPGKPLRQSGAVALVTPLPSPAARPAPQGRAPQSVRPAKKKPAANLNGGLWIYGRHSVAAALANPARKIRQVHATKNAASWLEKSGASAGVLATLEDTKPEIIDELLQEGAVHQGLAVLVEPLHRMLIEDACSPAQTGRPVLILDQITDPQNIGALFRSAAAFGARAVIVQDRRTPPLSGALAKAAAGAIEKVPCIEVVNIARAIEELQALGYFCAGLAGEAEAEISALPAAPLALVMGAEGDGLRRLVAEKCDQLFRIPIQPDVDSLNVSTAAAISLYEAQRSR
jgi:23S rRNA (guanosine2251-2'-O)-methyltransferase